jgi:hypothetical protein
LKNRNQLFLKIGIPIALLALGIFYYIVNPTTFLYTPKCHFHEFTGLHCPGCGSQRAIHQILHGNIWEGIKHNFLVAIGFLFISYKLYAFYFAGKAKIQIHILQYKAIPWVVIAIVFVFWILRNIPCEPFVILAP